jgi:hypothetical protein
MIRLLQPSNLAAAPGDQQIDVPIKTVAGRGYWYEFANNSPYVFEVQDDKGLVRGLLGAFKYVPFRINPITNQLTLHVVGTEPAPPIPAASWAVYGGITQSPLRPHSLAEGTSSAWSLSTGDPGDGIAAPNLVATESFMWLWNGTNWSRARSTLTNRSVSALNTQQQIVLELDNLNQVLDIASDASGGTATLTVEGSADNVNWITLDSIAAALSQTKHYNNTTVGATRALTPLAFRFVRITAGAAGAGNTTTLTVGVK